MWARSCGPSRSLNSRTGTSTANVASHFPHVRSAFTTQRIVKTQATYYDVLGVPANASVDEIKSAFRRQAKLVHPDVSKSEDSEEDFKRLKEAYDTLSDERQRAEYDESLAFASRRRSGRAAGVRHQRVVVVTEADSPWAEFIVEEEDMMGLGDDSDDDDDDDDDGFLQDELEFMAWATTGGNFQASFQSSWQSNGRKARRVRQGRKQQAPLGPQEKEVILQELPRHIRLTVQKVFGPKLQSLNTLEELAEILETMQSLEAMGVEFDLQGPEDGPSGRGGGGGRSGGGGRRARGPSMSSRRAAGGASGSGGRGGGSGGGGAGGAGGGGGSTSSSGRRRRI